MFFSITTNKKHLHNMAREEQFPKKRELLFLKAQLGGIMDSQNQKMNIF